MRRFNRRFRQSQSFMMPRQGETAVDEEGRAGDVVGIFGAQEGGGLADVGGSAEPAPGQLVPSWAIAWLPKVSCSPGVSIQPGSMVLTLIWWCVSSLAMVRAMLMSPLLPAL